MYLLTTYIFLCCKHVLVSVTHCVLRENQCNWFAFNCCLFLVAVILADGNKATGRPRGRSHGRFWPLKAEPTREPREQPTRSKSSSSTHRWASANHLLQAIWFHWPQLWLQPRCHEVGKQGDRQTWGFCHWTIELFIFAKKKPTKNSRETRQQKSIKWYCRGNSGQMANGKRQRHLA